MTIIIMEYYELLRQLVSMKYNSCNSCHSFKFVVRKKNYAVRNENIDDEVSET